jgi:chorismate mutase
MPTASHLQKVLQEAFCRYAARFSGDEPDDADMRSWLGGLHYVLLDQPRMTGVVTAVQSGNDAAASALLRDRDDFAAFVFAIKQLRGEGTASADELAVLDALMEFLRRHEARGAQIERLRRASDPWGPDDIPF